MSKVALSVLVVVLWLAPVASWGDDQIDETGEPTPLELFERRIMPIFRSPQPASCVQCHLAAVDLKDYILPSHEQTFASLRDQGLIDLEAPKKSNILTLIQMGEKDRDKEARLLHEQTRQAEYEAFAAWIVACCSDPELRELPRLTDTELAQPDRPDAVIRHARKSRIVDSFVRDVWSQRMRCFPCHPPDEIDENDPQHRVAVQRHADYVEQYGDRYAAVDELPADNWYASRHVLLLQDAPQAWPELVRVQLLVHAWDKQRVDWNEQPIAFTQNSLTPRRMVGGPLFLFREPSSDKLIHWDAESVTLPPGKYLIKAYVDSQRRLAADPTLMLGQDDYYGQVEITARWGKGFPEARRISGDVLK